jgi:hypothetical protein
MLLLVNKIGLNMESSKFLILLKQIDSFKKCKYWGLGD